MGKPVRPRTRPRRTRQETRRSFPHFVAQPSSATSPVPHRGELTARRLSVEFPDLPALVRVNGALPKQTPSSTGRSAACGLREKRSRPRGCGSGFSARRDDGLVDHRLREDLMQFTTLVDIAGRRRSPAGQLGIAAHCCVAGDPGEKLGRVAGDRRRPRVSSSVADGIRVLPRTRWLTRLIVSPLREPGLVGSRAAGDCFSRNSQAPRTA
jgi:hypothetical protein